MLRKLKNKFCNKVKRIIYSGQSPKVKKVLDKIEEIDLRISENREEIQKELSAVSTDAILSNVSMADMPLITYILSLKSRDGIFIEHNINDATILFNNRFIAKMSYLAVYIHFIEVNNDMLHIEGNISLPAILANESDFCVKNNDVIVHCRLEDRGLDLKLGSNVYEKRTVFEADIPILEGVNSVAFYNIINGQECIYGKINSMRFSPIADCIDNQFCVRDKWMLYIQNNKLCCELATEVAVGDRENLFEEEIRKRFPQKAEWAIGLRRDCIETLKNKKKPIWLFMDRVDRADDNAEALFEYARNCEEIDSYFIIESGTKDYDRLSKLGNIIPLNSREHLSLVLIADCIISSQANGVVENPFWDDAELFRDFYHNGKIIFLQHGIIKDDMSCTLYRYHTNFTGFVTSCKKEKESILEYPYFYTDKEVWLTGLPRYDKLYNDSKRLIMIAPTWRQGLMKNEWDTDKQGMTWNVTEDFIQTDYFRAYYSLLNNEILQHACEEYGYKLAFMPHPLMKPYLSMFEKSSHCIYWDADKSYREAFAESDLLITDYSSVAFDFSYLKKPVVYYQFDKEEFFKTHSYRQGYFDYERDGLGEVVYNENELIELIVGYIKAGCGLKKLYESRIEYTFEYVDNKNCERVFNCIRRCDKE